MLKENIQILREENSSLMSEVLELRNDIGLRDEQVGIPCGIVHFVSLLCCLSIRL